MPLNAGKKAQPVDVLQTDYEYCTIKCYVEGSRNDLGEPSRVLEQRATNVKCAIERLGHLTSSANRYSKLYAMFRQGIVDKPTYIMTLLASQTIIPGDIVIDHSETAYNVVHVINWHTHKEALLIKQDQTST